MSRSDVQRFIAISALLASTLAISIRAQVGVALPTPKAVPAPSAQQGPTLEATIDFVSDILQKQPALTWGATDANPRWREGVAKQSLQLVGPCNLQFDKTETSVNGPVVDARMDDNGNKMSRHLVDLSHGNLSKVEVKPWFGNFATILPANTKRVPVAGSDTVPDDKYNGIIQTIIPPTSFTLLNWQNETSTITFTKKTMMINDLDTSTLKPGDWMSVTAGKTKNGVTTAEFLSRLGTGSEPGGGISLIIADQDKAERVAKALIHALALCGSAATPAKPSLF